MQKISRIYLGGCGYRTAWHEGNVIPLTDPGTGEPTDTILQLENGGGKTTLLALVFSCFEPEQNRFLKHLQSKNHRFSEYFDQNGAPGYIVVEWLMPPRSAGASPYRLVVGQAVTVRNTTVPADVERLYFAFREQDGLSLESLPLPNLATPAAPTFQEFSRWLHEQQRKYPDVFPTRNQDEWKKHLKGERLIDLEMLQMQVNFSAQEGGFDAFVNFKSESEFLKKFFGLTLDQAKAEEARKLVVQVCEKHARKPEFQRRLNELTKFRGGLNTFAEAARVYLASLAAEGGVMLEGTLLSQALQARAAQLDAEYETESLFERAQRDMAAAAYREADELSRREATATHVWHRKRVEQAKSAKDDADRAVDRLVAKERHVRAARLQGDIRASQRQIDDLEALAEAARADLVMPREHAEVQGALFRRALFQEETRVSEVLKGMKARAEARESQKKAQTQLQEQAERDELALHTEDRRLRDAEERRNVRLQTLIRDALLSSEDEGVLDAIGRWQASASGYATERDSYIAQRKSAKETAVQRRADAKKERDRAGDYKASAQRLQAFLAGGEAERERLSQLPAILEAVESDIADPFSPLLLQMLNTVLSSCSKQVAAIDVRLAELGLTKQAIESSKVAGYSADVAQVVQVLRDAGVRSARPFNEYIAETTPDAVRARSLVLSDPARFLGVGVAKGEFEKAAAVSFNGRLPRKPVMVSVYALDPAPMSAERTVVPAENDAAFNVAAAATLAREIAGKVASDTAQRAALEARHLRTAKAIQDVETFTKTYGDGKLAKAAADEQAAREDASAAAARADAMDAEALEADGQADLFDGKARTAEGHRREALDAVRRLEEFRTEYEDGRGQRLHRLGELPALVLDSQERRAAAKAVLEDLQAEHDRDVEKRAQETLYHSELGRERADLKYYDREYDAEKDLAQNPRPLEELRRSYRAAEEHYLTNERERLGSLSVRIQAEKERKTEKTKEYNREYQDVAPDQFKHYIGVNHEQVLAENASELVTAKGVQAETSAAHVLAGKEAKTFNERNKAVIDTPTQDLLSQGLEHLDTMRAALGAQLEDAQRRMRAATEEANKAQSRAEAKKDASAQDLTADTLVRDALGLGDKPDLAYTVAKLAAETGLHMNTSGLVPPVLAVKAADQVSALLRDLDQKRKGTKKLLDAARRAFEALRTASGSKGFVEADADVAQQMQQNSFEDTCRDAERILTHLDDRIQTTDDTLKHMQADFDACIEEVSEVVRTAILTLTRACSPDKCVPAKAPYVGGKQVLKMRADFSRINTEARRTTMRAYLDWLAECKLVPARGTDLIADAVARVYEKPLGLQVLKMSIEETEQYVPLEKISNSGGEGVVMAMFLYLVINQLRAQNYADVQKSAGGPLILDNPFAKATSAAMWEAQRLLAREMNVQLIFATAIHDYNALGEFQRFVRMRKLQNQKTRRWHLEVANFTLMESRAEEVA